MVINRGDAIITQIFLIPVDRIIRRLGTTCEAQAYKQ